TWEKANPADFQIMSIAVTSDAMPLHELDFYADTYIAQQLSRILVYLYVERIARAGLSRAQRALSRPPA
ncbi:hypothetical protein, partial [Ramlibacter sp.]|uniref:hypothetical protein n=1 Tax=Ramlibacter sp. TaxID=1917967 RepID=UPI002622DBED